MKLPNAFFAAATITAVASLSAACAVKSASSDQTAASGDDVAQTETNSESLGSAFVSSGSGGSLAPASFVHGDLTTQNLNPQDFGANLFPAGCSSETEDTANHTNTYVFNDCTGPYGLVHLTGTVTVTYSSTGADNLTLAFSAQDFHINRATLSSWTANATVTASGSDRTMVWSAQLAGTTANGRSFTRTNNKTVAWTVGSGCVSVSGTSDGTITGFDLKTTVSNYNRCKLACPEANSDVDVLNETTNENVDIHFNGGPSATVTASGPRANGTITIALACGL